MKILPFLLLLSLPFISCTSQDNISANPAEVKSKASGNIYQFKVENLYGEVFDLADLKGKKVMIVNTASKCGLTPQYEGLQALYEKYGSDDFVIVGFPANDFLRQEPGSNEEIATFCEANYGVTFPMMAKISVKGKEIHPLYQYLTSQEMNGLEDAPVKWNFQKFLINKEGFLDKVMSPKTQPDAEEIISWIEG